jgi:hypothetical protein
MRAVDESGFGLIERYVGRDGQRWSRTLWLGPAVGDDEARDWFQLCAADTDADELDLCRGPLVLAQWRRR